MGIVDLKNLGGISGKIGPYVAYVTKDGKQVLRKHTIPRDPKTPKQQAYRMRFGLVNKALSPLNKIIKAGFKNEKNAYRSTVSKALNDAVMGEYPNYRFNYGKIQVTEGKLQLPTFVDILLEKESGKVTINWNPQLIFTTYPGKEDDHVNIVCLNESIPFTKKLVNVATRSAGSVSIDLKSKLGLSDDYNSSELHFWLYLSTNDLMMKSDSVYLKI